MRRSTTAALATALAAGAALALPAQAAAPTVDLQPHRLARGADIAVPHIEDGDFVDGDRRVELPGTAARIIGPSGGGWMVATHRTNSVGETRGGRVVQVMASDSVRTVLRDADPADVVLSEDGASLLAVVRPRGRSGTVRVWAPVDGVRVAERTFRGYPEIVTASGSEVLLRSNRRTFWWTWAKDVVRPVTRHLTGPASIEHDLLAIFTRDPYLGGCTRLARLRHPKVTVWRSCHDRVAAFSPDGSQLMTVGILADGLGPGRVHLRGVDGARLATWTTSWFSGWEWEAPGTVLLDVNGRRKASVVRCTLGRCENATDPVRVSAP